MKITMEELMDWIGQDDPYDILLDVANGDYPPEQLKENIIDYKEVQNDG